MSTYCECHYITLLIMSVILSGLAGNEAFGINTAGVAQSFGFVRVMGKINMAGWHD